jgi:hypothetical protein
LQRSLCSGWGVSGVAFGVCEGWWGWEGTILDEEDKNPVGFGMRVLQ